MPLQATSGAASYDAFGGGVPVEPNYIESVFSTFLYTGNGSTQTINNGIDLAGEGGLVWIKRRNAVANHALFDTARGATKKLYSDLTNAEYTDAYSLTSFNADGFSVDLDGSVNNGSGTYASWTFRKQPKFFDVVTYTGNGALATRYISHSLGSVPGTIIVKRTDTTSDWIVIHRGTTFPLILNSTAAATSTNRNNGYPDLTYTDATQFAVSDGASGVSAVNASGGTYVAYLFAHNAGGFGLTGTDNVISCGSYTGNGSATGPVINLGYEPQWLLIKDVTTTKNWYLVDSMRGMAVGGASSYLVPNLSNAEGSVSPYISPTATGFQIATTDSSVNFSGDTYIYIAIRRGPMKTPTSGTSVFAPSAISADNTTISTGFPVDMFLENLRTGSAANTMAMDRLRGSTVRLTTSSTNAESSSGSGAFVFDDNTGYQPDFFVSGSIVSYAFRRTPGFFDEVCYTGDNTYANSQRPHNLGVPPELTIIKGRNETASWQVLWNQQRANLNLAYGFDPSPYTANTSTLFSTSQYANGSSSTTYVAYLFASCPGVSKCGSYTGTGTTQQINCGFTAGARFVLIKRTDSTGDWVLWDSSRGMVAGTDPRLALNSTAAEVNQNWVYTTTGGFQIVTSDATVNASGGSYIYLSIA